jgi:hypothetical protein
LTWFIKVIIFEYDEIFKIDVCKQLLCSTDKIRLDTGAELFKTTTKTLIDSATNPNCLFYGELKY